LAPGSYLIGARPAPPAAPAPPGQPAPAPTAFSGSTLITAGLSDVSNVSVSIRKGVVMSGRLVFAGGSAPPPAAQLSQIGLRLDPVDRALPGGAPIWRGQVEADGQFRTTKLPPGVYPLRVDSAPAP